jgi:hypothetical protein
MQVLVLDQKLSYQAAPSLSWDIAEHTSDNYTGDGAANPRWIDFASLNTTSVSSSYTLDFKGVNYVPTITMLSHAPKGELNYSNNPTFVSHGQSLHQTASVGSSKKAHN